MAREIDVDSIVTPRMDRERRIATGLALCARGASLREAAAIVGLNHQDIHAAQQAISTDVAAESPPTSRRARIAAMAEEALENGITRVRDEITTTDPRNVAGWLKESRETYLSAGDNASDGVSALASTIFDRLAASGLNVSIEITQPADSIDES